jgi:hypothetical protein
MWKVTVACSCNLFRSCRIYGSLSGSCECCQLLGYVVLYSPMWTDVSEKRIVSVFSAENQPRNNWLATCCTLVSCLADFRPWRQSWYVPPKRRFTCGLRDAVSQKMATLFLSCSCWRRAWVIPYAIYIFTLMIHFGRKEIFVQIVVAKESVLDFWKCALDTSFRSAWMWATLVYFWEAFASLIPQITTHWVQQWAR